MFEDLKRKGLAGRLIAHAGANRNNPLVAAIVFEVAKANYPDNTNAPGLPPLLTKEHIWRITKVFLDRGTGTINDLFIQIWGMGIEEYMARLTESTDPHAH